MICVITGDIKNSRKLDAEKWLTRLKKELKRFGATPKYWEVFSGDSFQLRVNDPAQAFITATTIKAAIMSLPRADVRMSIGIGAVNHEARKITECNGEAFINSGEQFEQLAKIRQDLAIKTPWAEFDVEMNLYLKLVQASMKNWTANTAEVVWLAITNPTESQEALGKKIGIKQNAISNRLKRANYDVLMEVNTMFVTKLNQQV